MKKLFCFALMLALLLTAVGCGKIKNTGSAVYLNISENSTRGVLSGELEVNLGGAEYDIYFGDENGRLDGYTKIGTGQGSYVFDDVVIPPEATHIVIDAGGAEYMEKIPEECLFSGEDAFIFGVLSDVHYNRYYESGKDDALYSFDLALDYFEKIGADFVSVAGDISASGEESAFEKYNADIENRPFPVYTVTGNHDVSALESGLWKSEISDNISGCVFAPNGLDFVYAPKEMGGGVFVFLNQVRWEYGTQDSTILDESQLIWLEGVLEENKDGVVYLFFHTFLCGTDGQGHTGVGNIKNPGGYSYDLPYTYGGSDEVMFRGLMQEYKNVVYFSGHSHWMFEMEIYGENANFSNFDGEYCYMVHVPSVTEPRWIGENDTSRTGMNTQSSQGWVVYDYGDASVFVPVDFITGTVYTEYLEIVY